MCSMATRDNGHTMDVFQAFTNQPYVFLVVDQTANGNEVIDEIDALGIVKLRDGMMQTDNLESRTSDTTIHIRPTESFIATLDGQLEGNGIRVYSGDGDPIELRITGQTVGRNEDTGIIEHYRVTCKKESFVWDESDLSVT